MIIKYQNTVYNIAICFFSILQIIKIISLEQNIINKNSAFLLNTVQLVAIQTFMENIKFHAP
jgi:hypothetical protein